jgi:perosamine synthetase
VSTSFEPGAPTPDDVVPLCVPSIGGNAWQYVKDCLDTGWVSSVGEYVTRFEKMTAERLGAKHAVAVVNGTSALHTALVCSGVQAGDEVLVSSLTFIATANAVRYAGATAIPIDAEPDYWQIDPAKIEAFLVDECTRVGDRLVNRRSGRRVSAIVPAHILGHPVDLDPILEIAARFGLKVVEDAAEGLGAAYKGRAVGRIAPVGCLSFNGNKLITTGGGGMVVTDDDAIAARARYLTTQAKDDPIEYVHGELGYNYRLTNLQAALGCAQMEQLDDHITAKRRIAAAYRRGLADVPGVTVMPEAPWADSVYWLYTVAIDEARFGMSSRALLKQLAGERVQTRPLWQPMHRSPVHSEGSFQQCPVADQLNRDALSLPSSVELTPREQERVIAGIRAAANGNRRRQAA